jgi:hypothetical protein
MRMVRGLYLVGEALRGIRTSDEKGFVTIPPGEMVEFLGHVDADRFAKILWDGMKVHVSLKISKNAPLN